MICNDRLFKTISLVHLQECAHRFPVPLYNNEGKKTDKFILSGPPEQLKCVVTLTGDSITNAVSTNCIKFVFRNKSFIFIRFFYFQDISFKVQRQNQNQIQRTSITQDNVWKIQQIQDAANHLQQGNQSCQTTKLQSFCL